MITLVQPTLSVNVVVIVGVVVICGVDGVVGPYGFPTIEPIPPVPLTKWLYLPSSTPPKKPSFITPLMVRYQAKTH